MTPGGRVCPIHVGRAAVLERASQGVRRREYGVVVVMGEAGMGKTRLLTELTGDDERLAAPSEKEAQVASLVAAGCTNAEVARRLYMSSATVTNHVGSILLKLGLHRRSELAQLTAPDSAESARLGDRNGTISRVSTA